jgi:UDP-galactopyranose mutase
VSAAPLCGHARRGAIGAPTAPPALFASFWQGGFESACHVNRAGARLDMIAATQHDLQVDEDYARLAALGIRTCREGLRWPHIEREGTLDFSSVIPFASAARKHGIEIIWNLCHYGWPDDVDLFSPAFPARFARFAREAARVLAASGGHPPLYVAMNEVSFLAWAAGEEGYIFPHGRGCGARVKQQLLRAAILATEAIRETDPRARFVCAEPLIHVMAPLDRPDLAPAAAAKCRSQLEALDVLLGRRAPELGGSPQNVDVVGVNFYHSNQWEHSDDTERRDMRLRWEDTPRDPRWVPLSSLLADVYERYERPILISETSHFGAGRGRWIREIAAEVREALSMGVPVAGICLYPIIDRHDWDDPCHWHHSGLWELARGSDGRLERSLDADYARALSEARCLLDVG